LGDVCQQKACAYGGLDKTPKTNQLSPSHIQQLAFQVEGFICCHEIEKKKFGQGDIIQWNTSAIHDPLTSSF
jgi:hypothetical protein